MWGLDRLDGSRFPKITEAGGYQHHVDAFIASAVVALGVDHGERVVGDLHGRDFAAQLFGQQLGQRRSALLLPLSPFRIEILGGVDDDHDGNVGVSVDHRRQRCDVGLTAGGHCAALEHAAQRHHDAAFVAPWRADAGVRDGRQEGIARARRFGCVGDAAAHRGERLETASASAGGVVDRSRRAVLIHQPAELGHQRGRTRQLLRLLGAGFASKQQARSAAQQARLKLHGTRRLAPRTLLLRRGRPRAQSAPRPSTRAAAARGPRCRRPPAGAPSRARRAASAASPRRSREPRLRRRVRRVQSHRLAGQASACSPRICAPAVSPSSNARRASPRSFSARAYAVGADFLAAFVAAATRTSSIFVSTSGGMMGAQTITSSSPPSHT